MNPAPDLQLSVVMPLYNEAAGLAANVEQTLGALRMLGPFELILADDGSTDRSGEEIARLSRLYPGEIVPLSLPHAGKGEALRQGAHRARGKTFPRSRSSFSSPSSA
jgi:dolichol-phosphate mannosyltransferase